MTDVQGVARTLLLHTFSNLPTLLGRTGDITLEREGNGLDKEEVRHQGKRLDGFTLSWSVMLYISLTLGCELVVLCYDLISHKYPTKLLPSTGVTPLYSLEKARDGIVRRVASITDFP